MAQVLEFDPVAAAPEPPAHRRIRRASKVLAALFGLFLIAAVVFDLVIGSAFIVPWAGDHLTIGPSGLMLHIGAPPGHPAGYIEVGALAPLQRLAHVAMGFVVFVPALMILWNLRQLFRLYGQGEVFSADNARRIKHIGVWLLANSVAPLISVSVLGALGMAVDHAWFHADTIPKAVLGGVVYVIGMVMEVGREIEEERGQFV